MIVGGGLIWRGAGGLCMGGIVKVSGLVWMARAPVNGGTFIA